MLSSIFKSYRVGSPFGVDVFVHGTTLALLAFFSFHQFIGGGIAAGLSVAAVIAAVMVLVGHSYPLIGAASEPLLANRSLGYIAVDVFFFTSGLLVTRSLLTRNNLLGFAWARALRIYPALIVAVLFCALPLGLAWTSLSAAEYVTHPDTWRFVGVNCTMLGKRVVYELPGVFAEVPYARTVNGSLWTLPWELRMYALLGLLGLFGVVISRAGSRPEWRQRWIQVGVFAVATLFVVASFRYQWTAWGAHDRKMEGLRLGAMFFLGGSVYLLRRHVWLSLWGCLAIGVLGWAAGDHPRVLSVVYTLGLGYWVLFLAYVPIEGLRRFQRGADYSYGLYIYAFPVQQSILACAPSIGLIPFLVSSLVATWCLAALSWHAVERPALGQKERYRRWFPSREAPRGTS